MPLGAFAPLPIRLGGSAEEGWIARHHARVCADLVAAKRASPLAVMTYTKAGATVTIHDYYGQNGAGSAYQPDSVVVVGTRVVTFKWTLRLFEDPYEVQFPINAKHGKATGHGTASLRGEVTVFANGVTVSTFDSAPAAADGKVTVVLY
jgi:hypothetical protein